jgi:hypothetical protein
VSATQRADQTRRGRSYYPIGSTDTPLTPLVGKCGTRHTARNATRRNAIPRLPPYASFGGFLSGRPESLVWSV